MLSTQLKQTLSPDAGKRINIADVMKYEILINEQSRLWVFHDKVLPGRLAWAEYDPATQQLSFIPHDMTRGMLYADIPAALAPRIQKTDLVYLYQTDGEKVTGFQKAPIQIKRA